MSSVVDSLRTRWTQTQRGDSASLFEKLAAHYQEPHRYYHTLDHLAMMFEIVDSFPGHSFDLPTVELAVWFHDVIYDPRVKDNEEQSAEFAKREILPSLQVEVQRLILLTKTHTWDEADREGQILLDADLAILGTSPPIYDAYARAIRREYTWVPLDDYRVGRAKVLASFLNRERIYATESMCATHEAPARKNLERELSGLESGKRNAE